MDGKLGQWLAYCQDSSKTIAMELRQFKYFQAVARRLSFREAAAELNIAQSAVSRQIQALEAYLGVPLFERSGRSVFLTREGQLVYDRIDEILMDVRRLVRDVHRAGKGQLGELRIGYIGTLCGDYLPSVISRIRRDFPDTVFEAFELNATDQVDWMLDGKIDLGLIGLGVPAQYPRISRVKVGELPMKVIVAQDHPASTRERIEATELSGEKLLLTYEQNAPLYNYWLMEQFSTAGVPIIPRYLTQRAQGVLLKVAMGEGIAVFPAPVVKFAPRGVKVLSLLDAWSFNFQAIVPKSGQVPVAQSVIQEVAKELKCFS